MTETLFEKVIAQILTDIASKDLTAIKELLNKIPQDCLRAYLPEFSGLYED